MSSKLFLLSAVIVLLYSNYKLIKAEDLTPSMLLDLTCIDDHDCVSFRSNGINSMCYTGECKCFDDRNTTLICKPVIKNIQNLIGDACPCTVANSSCHPRNNTCVCNTEYTSSVDRTTCVAIERNITAAVGECDDDTVCVNRDVNSRCDMRTKMCVCAANYTLSEKRCVPIFVDLTDRCKNDADCTVHRNHTVCVNATCSCQNEYIFVNKTTECLPISSYGHNCSRTDDCRMVVGSGVCDNGKCVCDPDHYKHEIKGKGIRCIKKTHVGDNCTRNTDCFEAYRHHQVMECLSSKCKCLPKYKKTNESRCESGAVRMIGTNLTILIVLSNLLFIYQIIIFANYN